MTWDSGGMQFLKRRYPKIKMAENTNYVSTSLKKDFPLWKKLELKRSLVSLEFEITPRCNNNCTHCYISLSPGDKVSMSKELSLSEIKNIVSEAVDLGVYTALITGGEPMLRHDFSEIFMLLKKQGFIVSVFTNATLINQKIIDLFTKYPPHNIEVSVYGVTQKTYETISRVPGTFKAFMNGVNLLVQNNIPVRFKAMALRSNIHELKDIARFCRERTKDYFRFDPQLHLRYDRDEEKNKGIKSERLSPDEISNIEQSDRERSDFLVKNKEKYIFDKTITIENTDLFSCGMGNGSLTVGYDGFIRGCSSLYHKDMMYNWREGSLIDAWQNFYPSLLEIKTDNKMIMEKCRNCNIVNLCMSCPAHNYLETGDPTSFTEYFCNIAHSRSEKMNNSLQIREDNKELNNDKNYKSG